MSDDQAHRDLDERLRARRTPPGADVVDSIAARIPRRADTAPRASLRLALAGALVVALASAVAAVGGVGYASNQVNHAFKAVKRTAVPTRSDRPTLAKSADKQYKGVPGILGFEPKAACVGDRITVTGENFIGTTSVLLGGISAKFKVKDDTRLDAWVPAGFTGGRITVITDKGSVENEQDLKLKHPGCVA
jgi:hypothetical protein